MWQVHLFTSQGEIKWQADTIPYFHNREGTAPTTSVLTWSYKGQSSTLAVGSMHSVLITRIG